MAKSTAENNQGQEPSTEYFARIPYTVFDARESGELTPSMFLAMVWLFKWADWSTGRVEKMCAERLVWATEGEFEKRTFEEALQNLKKAGWILSHHKQGSKRPYRVDICNYVALSGAQKNQILNPSDIKTWRSTQTNAPRGRRADSAQTGRGEHREVNREVNGSPSATTMRVSTENTTRDSSGDSSGDSEPSLIVTEKTAAAENFPPQIREVVDWLCQGLRSAAFRSKPKAIPIEDIEYFRETFLKKTNALIIPFLPAIELFEQTVREFLYPGKPTEPNPIPKHDDMPDFQNMKPLVRAHVLWGRVGPQWLGNKFNRYLKSTFGKSPSKLTPDECIVVWRRIELPPDVN